MFHVKISVDEKNSVLWILVGFRDRARLDLPPSWECMSKNCSGFLFRSGEHMKASKDEHLQTNKV